MKNEVKFISIYLNIVTLITKHILYYIVCYIRLLKFADKQKYILESYFMKDVGMLPISHTQSSGGLSVQQSQG